MKNIFLLTFLILGSLSGFSQTESNWERNNLNIRIGPEIGFAIGDLNRTQNLGLGISGLLDIPVLPRYSLTLYSGYISFSGNVIPNGSGTKYRRANIFPIRAGVNYKLSPNTYAGAQLGHASMSYLSNSKSGLSQSIGIGYFNRRFDLGARWDHQYMHGGLSSINIKLAYVLQLGLKR